VRFVSAEPPRRTPAPVSGSLLCPPASLVALLNANNTKLSNPTTQSVADFPRCSASIPHFGPSLYIFGTRLQTP
jgi:hypothetical protein